MKKNKFNFSGRFLMFLLSVFLITAGVSRYIETDSGNILIHDIEVESYEGYLYGARLFRPIQASSMNRRPSILLVPGISGSRYSGDHIAMEFARRGFVVLTIEKDPDGFSGPKPKTAAENPIDSAYTFLTTRFFTDNERIGLISFYDSADWAAAAEHFQDFTSYAFVSPRTAALPNDLNEVLILTAGFETDPLYRIQSTESIHVEVIPCSHAGIIFHNEVIASLLEKFHEDLAIPNDSPFWFSSDSQHAQLLLILRFLLLLILLIICTGIAAILNKRQNLPLKRQVFGFILPVAIFAAASEFMNFFIISVRLGSPFHYLQNAAGLIKNFSLVPCCLITAAAVLISFPLGKKRQLLLCDPAAMIMLSLSLFGFLPILFGNRSGWEMLSVTRFRWSISLTAFFTCLGSLLLRIEKNNQSRKKSAILIGLMYYFICCGIPAEILF